MKIPCNFDVLGLSLYKIFSIFLMRLSVISLSLSLISISLSIIFPCLSILLCIILPCLWTNFHLSDARAFCSATSSSRRRTLSLRSFSSSLRSWFSHFFIILYNRMASKYVMWSEKFYFWHMETHAVIHKRGKDRGNVAELGGIFQEICRFGFSQKPTKSQVTGVG